VTEYLTGEQVIERLLKRNCDECGEAILDTQVILVTRTERGLRWTVECPNCGASESFEAVASGN
jgi:hypothetical protein